MPDSQSSEVRIGRFRVDRRRRCVFDGERPVALHARAFDLLLALIEHGDAGADRDALLQRVWPGRIVADENLKMQVMALRKALGADAVVTLPRRGYRLGFAVRPVAPPRPDDAAAAAADGLLGRDVELRQLVDALPHERLLTIAGSGGVGKTRLALALVGVAAARHADGAVVLDLSGVHDAGALPPLLAREARLADSGGDASADAVAATMRELQLLLVLDNCEHLVAAVAAMAGAVLRAAPGVHVVATSQVPLGLPGERVLRLGGLALPDAAPAEGVAGDEPGADAAAVRLFVDRVARLDPAFTLTAANRGAVFQICRQLDGVPLALELAAARVPLLGVAGVAERLHAPLQLLRGGAAPRQARHRTLRDALRWSHGLLEAHERRLFRRLGVFVGGFGWAGAAAMLPDDDRDPPIAEWDALAVLQSLIDKSLVQPDAAGEGRRYRLLESARAFALEELAAADEEGAVRQRHARHVLQVFEDASARAFGEPALRWTAPLKPELANLRAAMHWALSPAGRGLDPLLAPRIAAAAGAAWTVFGLDDDARRCLDAAGEALDAAAPAALRAGYWLAMANRGTDHQMTAAVALAAAQRALDAFDEIGDAAGAYRSLALLLQHGQRTPAGVDAAACIARMRALESPDWSVTQRRSLRWAEARQLWRAGDWAGYADAFRVERMLCRDAGDVVLGWSAAHSVALAELMLGRPDAAVAVTAPMVDEIRALGLARRYWTHVAVHAMACIGTRDVALATAAVREVLPLLRGARALWWLGDHLAWWLLMAGDAEGAARLGGWIDARRAVRGEPMSPQSRQAVQAIDEGLAAALPPERRAALREAGARADDTQVAIWLARALDG